MKLTPRQKQIAVLKQRGAKDKEIAQVLGIDESTVKSHYKKVRTLCREWGVDIFSVPIEKTKRMAEFHKLARVEYYKLRFGETDDFAC